MRWYFTHHIDAATGQGLAERAFAATERLMFGKAKRVRFKSVDQLDSIEGADNNNGPLWRNDSEVQWYGMTLKAMVDPENEVQLHGLQARVKYVRIVRRRRSGRTWYYVQLVNEGRPFPKEKHWIGTGTVGLDIGPSTIAIVSPEKAILKPFCNELANQDRQIRRLQRQMQRSQRANNPENYELNFKDKKGRLKQGKVKRGAKNWRRSRRYLGAKDRKAELERKLAAHRKSLQNQLAHEVLSLGNHIQFEKLSYKAFQKLFGKSIGRRAPKQFLDRLRVLAENADEDVSADEFSTYKTKLSQRCLCGRFQKKSLSQREHRCACGLAAQRDLFSAFLARFVEIGTNEFHVGLARKAWETQGWDSILSTAWEVASATYKQSSIGRPRGSSNAPASEGIGMKSFGGNTFKSQNGVVVSNDARESGNGCMNAGIPAL